MELVNIVMMPSLSSGPKENHTATIIYVQEGPVKPLYSQRERVERVASFLGLGTRLFGVRVHVFVSRDVRRPSGTVKYKISISFLAGQATLGHSQHPEYSESTI